MQRVKFGKSLFGFKRRQVIEYIAETEASFEGEKKALSDKLSRTEAEISDYADKAVEAQKAAARALADASEEQRKRAEAEKNAEAFAAECTEQRLKCQLAENELDGVKKDNERYLKELAERDNTILSLKNEVREQSVAAAAIKLRLIKAQEKTAQNEQAYIKSRSMLTDYLDVLHKENIELMEQNARLSSGVSEAKQATDSADASADEILAAIREGIGKILSEQKTADAPETPGERKLKIL